MKYTVNYKVGDSIRSKRIEANNLDEAETIANEKFKNWEDIILVDKTKGTCEY